MGLSRIGVDQTLQYAEYVSSSLPQHLIEDLLECAQNAQVPEQYVRDHNVNFLYEMLQREGWQEKVRTLAELWLKVSFYVFSCLNIANDPLSERRQC